MSCALFFLFLLLVLTLFSLLAWTLIPSFPISRELHDRHSHTKPANFTSAAVQGDMKVVEKNEKRSGDNKALFQRVSRLQSHRIKSARMR